MVKTSIPLLLLFACQSEIIVSEMKLKPLSLGDDVPSLSVEQAEQAVWEGDNQLAYHIYMSVALSQPQPAAGRAACNASILAGLLRQDRRPALLRARAEGADLVTQKVCGITGGY